MGERVGPGGGVVGCWIRNLEGKGKNSNIGKTNELGTKGTLGLALKKVTK